MPELPEVQTTVNGLSHTIVGKTIVELWSDLPTPSHSRKTEIKHQPFWNHFVNHSQNQTITEIRRRGKNILIFLSNGFTIVIHMKMTGHLLFGNYRTGTDHDGLPHHTWVWWSDQSTHLQDPFNRFIHFVMKFSDGTNLAFCDSRKFGSITLVEHDKLSTHFQKLGPDALDETLSLKDFTKLVMKHPKAEIKTILMNQEVITGVGNIYSDELLWLASVHPSRTPQSLTAIEWKKIFESMKKVLTLGIDFGGDSTSDYRNVFGLRGDFHHTHNAYRLTGKPCKKKNCTGGITRKIIGGRSAHFCSVHQK